MLTQRNRISIISGHLRPADYQQADIACENCAATQVSQFGRYAQGDAAYAKPASATSGRAERVHETALLYSSGATHGSFDNHEVVKHNPDPKPELPSQPVNVQAQDHKLEIVASKEWVPQVDTITSSQYYIFVFKLPGVKADDVQLDLRGDRLLISGKRLQGSTYNIHVSRDVPFVRRLAPATWRKSLDGGREMTIEQERHIGNFSLVWTLPNGDYDGMLAEFVNGKLRVTLPRCK